MRQKKKILPQRQKWENSWMRQKKKPSWQQSKEEKPSWQRQKGEVSIRSALIRRMIADINATVLGKPIQTGEFRKHPMEPEWVCPPFFNNDKVQMEQFTMDFLSKKDEGEETQLERNLQKIMKKSDEFPNQDKVILQLHGGGYIGPIKNIYYRFATRYSEVSLGASVLTIDYRVAPEHPFPAALEDAVAAYQWLLEELKYKGEDIIVAGDSAGGGLCLCLGHYLKDNNMPMPAAFICMSPWTDLTLSGDSYEENFKNDPLFGNTKESMIYEREYLKEEDDKENPYISPLFGDFSGFSPILFQVGSIEMLLSDSLSAAKKASESGVDVKLTVYDGMFHDFQMAGNLLPESKKAWEEVGNFINNIWK